ncbi:hypothetical protein ABID96_003526 [Bacillus sp. OAE603]
MRMVLLIFYKNELMKIEKDSKADIISALLSFFSYSERVTLFSTT